MNKISEATQRAAGKYGVLNLLTAVYACDVHGEGANSIRLTVNLPGVPDSVTAVDACISAGREYAAALRAAGSLSYRANGEAEGFVGSGVDVFRAAVIASALRLYAKTGMKANRAYTPRNMIAAAVSMTGRKYGARDYMRAADDLSTLCTLMKWAIGA